MPEDSPEATEPQNNLQAHQKPLLTIPEQIAHLKSKGVTFSLCTEQEAAAFLTKNNYLRTASDRKLYEQRIDSDRAGTYIGLDFGDLIALSRIDRRLREALLLAASDIEHFAKVHVLNRAESESEDGYAIVRDFYENLNHSERNRIQGMLKTRGSTGEQHDNYTGDLIAHYGVERLPLWIVVEVMEFGPFLTLYKHCAGRWNDSRMLQEHYVLKSVKALRNATAHGSCIVNGFTKKAERAGYEVNTLVATSMSKAGMPNTKTRRSKMRNLRIAQITSTLWAVEEFCPTETCQTRHALRFAELERFIAETGLLTRANDGIVSFFDFFEKLVDIWIPLRP